MGMAEWWLHEGGAETEATSRLPGAPCGTAHLEEPGHWLLGCWVGGERHRVPPLGDFASPGHRHAQLGKASFSLLSLENPSWPRDRLLAGTLTSGSMEPKARWRRGGGGDAGPGGCKDQDDENREKRTTPG